MALTFELFELCIRVVLGLVLGAFIGLERQWRSGMAGIRTNALVAAGSALFVVLGAYAFDGASADPTRVAAQVVSGIGFLGAGIIMRDGLNVRGLNTAATLWCAAAVGSLAGSGLYLVAGVGAMVIISANVLLRPISRLVRRFSKLPEEIEGRESDEIGYVLEAVTNDKSESRIRAIVIQAVTRPEFNLHSVDVKVMKNAQVAVRAGLSAGYGADHSALERAVQRISLDPKVTRVHWWAETGD